MAEPEHAPLLVRNLRAAGAVVEYEDPPETWRFLDENSAMEVIAAALALNHWWASSCATVPSLAVRE